MSGKTPYRKTADVIKKQVQFLRPTSAVKKITPFRYVKNNDIRNGDLYILKPNYSFTNDIRPFFNAATFLAASSASYPFTPK